MDNTQAHLADGAKLPFEQLSVMALIERINSNIPLRRCVLRRLRAMLDLKLRAGTNNDATFAAPHQSVRQLRANSHRIREDQPGPSARRRLNAR
jgi:hypothetical protein